MHALLFLPITTDKGRLGGEAFSSVLRRDARERSNSLTVIGDFPRLAWRVLIGKRSLACRIFIDHATMHKVYLWTNELRFGEPAWLFWRFESFLFGPLGIYTGTIYCYITKQ